MPTCVIAGDRVAGLLFTQFADKIDLLGPWVKTKGVSTRSFKAEMKEIRKLRDRVAHANNYAIGRDAERRTADTIVSATRWLRQIKEWAA